MAMEAETQLIDIRNREAPLAMVVNGSVHTFLEPFENGAAAEERQDEQDDPSNVPSGDALKGKQIRKKFGRKFYTGTVSEYEPDTNWYKVVYEDGDSEELEWAELKPLIAAQEQVSAKKRRGGASTPKSKKMRKTKPLELVVEEKIDLNQAIEQNGGDSVEEPEPGQQRLLVVESFAIEVETGVNPDDGAIAAAAEKGEAEEQEKEQVQVKGKKRGRPAKAKTAKVGKAGGKAKKAAASKPTGTPRRPAKRAKTEASKGTPRKSGRLSQTPVSEVVSPAGKQRKQSPGKRKLGQTKPSSAASVSPQKKRLSAATKGKKVQESQEEETPGLSSRARGSKLRGRKLTKEFDGRTFHGEVAGYSSKTRYYKISYEDGDEEELEWRELEPLLLEEEAVSSSSAEAAGTSKRSSTKRAAKTKPVSPRPLPPVTRSNQKLRARRKTSSVS
ncbi:uncharacterized protein LOC112348727 [Selaginella moellendorffii]|uniref:uncharacterized protein LOC112348727 n=1 Tax=Selaginella moellendorffii TaxID=88036 RepID=UPI000D1C4C9D|nr:uncharacterized protein LOC112348727 [Selaginella moellendorffii]XP_024537555.1 uncharacterized protein LOC112348727 [Selaginella moellendorffii]|eukprot:XP_024537554.1 uncharacterized protein LOC112348727 [Selaginella moellendorffii]